MPPHLLPTEDYPYAIPVEPGLRRWVRCCLVLIALVLVGVFAIAVCLDPYRDNKVWYEGTHTQMRLPVCTFKWLTGMPCPSCGMTSSFALLMRGDVGNSLKANCVGTLLALFLLAVIPWSVVSALRSKLLWVRSVERVLVCLVLVFLISMLLRWGIVLLFPVY